MATSGILKGSTNKNYAFQAEWKRNSFDATQRYSNITVKLIVYRSDGYSASAYNIARKPAVSLSLGGASKAPSISYIDTRKGQRCVFATWTGNVYHDKNGDLELSVNASFTHYGSSSLTSGSLSGSIMLDKLLDNTVPILSYSECNVGDKIGITLNRTNGSYVHKLSYSYLGNEGDIARNVGTYHEWEIPDSFIDNITSAPSADITINCVTYSGEEEIGTAEAIVKVNVPKREDTLPIINASLSPDVSSLPDALREAFSGKYIKGKTRICADLTESYAQRGAVLSSAISWSIRYPTATSELGTMAYQNDSIPPPNEGGTATVVITITDSRGFSSSSEHEITVADYKNPLITPHPNESSVIIARGYSDGENAVRSAGAQNLYIKAKKISYPNGNSCTFKAEVKEQDASEYGTAAEGLTGSESDPDNVVTVLTDVILDRAKLYSVRLTVTDLFGESSTFETVVPAASCTIHEGKGGKHLGLGGFCDYDFHSDGGYIDNWWALREHEGVGNIPHTVTGTENIDTAAMDEEIALYSDEILKFDGFYRFIYEPRATHSLFGNAPMLVEGYRNDSCGWQRISLAADDPIIFMRNKADGEWGTWRRIGGALQTIFEDSSGKTAYWGADISLEGYDLVVYYASPSDSASPVCGIIPIRYAIGYVGGNMKVQIADNSAYTVFVFNKAGFYTDSGNNGKIYALYGIKF